MELIKTGVLLFLCFPLLRFLSNWLPFLELSSTIFFSIYIYFIIVYSKFLEKKCITKSQSALGVGLFLIHELACHFSFFFFYKGPFCCDFSGNFCCNFERDFAALRKLVPWLILRSFLYDFFSGPAESLSHWYCTSARLNLWLTQLLIKFSYVNENMALYGLALRSDNKWKHTKYKINALILLLFFMSNKSPMLYSFVGFHILNKHNRWIKLIGAFHVWLSTFCNWVELTIIYHFSVNSKKIDENAKAISEYVDSVIVYCNSLKNIIYWER